MVAYDVIDRKKNLAKLCLLGGGSVLMTPEVVSSEMMLQRNHFGALHRVVVT